MGGNKKLVRTEIMKLVQKGIVKLKNVHHVVMYVIK
jgi:hypothetical protein